MSSEESFEALNSSDDDSSSPSPVQLGSSTSHDARNLSKNKRKRIQWDSHLPYKRRGRSFNISYLDLLNHDIEDASQSYTLDELPQDIYASQIGVTTWTAAEKKVFFEAIARLGKCDLPGISARIPSKSTMEIAYYMKELEKGAESRQRRVRDKVFKSDIPAATEISPQCCLALEQAADAASLRQQRFEESREQQKWQDFPWNITPDVARNIDDGQLGQNRPFTRLFNLSRWLELSDRVFMNASFPENNWHCVDEKPPSMQSTAFEDFYNVAVSITRRIVSDAVRIAESRIGMKGRVDSRTRRLVNRRDVEAAVVSLGLPCNGRKFWATSARRLRLGIFDENAVVEDSQDTDTEPDVDIMSFDDVERALHVGPQGDARLDEDDSLSEPESILDLDDDSHGADTDSDSNDSKPSIDEIEDLLEEHIQDQIDDEGVRVEAREVAFYAAIDLRNTTRTIDAVKRRIIAERKEEDHANAEDVAASAREEVDLWGLLGRDAPSELIAKTRAPPPVNRETISAEDVFRRDDWREETSYVGQWEDVLPEK